MKVSDDCQIVLKALCLFVCLAGWCDSSLDYEMCPALREAHPGASPDRILQGFQWPGIAPKHREPLQRVQSHSGAAEVADWSWHDVCDVGSDLRHDQWVQRPGQDAFRPQQVWWEWLLGFGCNMFTFSEFLHMSCWTCSWWSPFLRLQREPSAFQTPSTESVTTWSRSILARPPHSNFGCEIIRLLLILFRLKACMRCKMFAILCPGKCLSFHQVSGAAQALHFQKYNLWWSMNAKKVKKSVRNRLRWSEETWGRNIDQCCLFVWGYQPVQSRHEGLWAGVGMLLRSYLFLIKSQWVCFCETFGD